ncbi:MAG: hypothetical protein ACLP7O_06535 [Terracidiphilus sp.]
MANCMTCNVEFDPASGSSKNFCPKHCAPTPQSKGAVANFYDELNSTQRAQAWIVISVLLIVCIYGCASLVFGPSEFKYPTSVLDHKTLAVDGNTEFDVTLKLREFNGSVPGSVFAASSEMLGIIKHELEEHSTEQGIVFHIVEDTGGGYDIYGRKQPTHLTDAFDIRYSMEDLKLINWNTVSNNGRWLMDLGSVSHMTGAGDDAIRKYCEDDGFKRYAQVFCANY